ncbi:peptide-methionine (R)-S-oxide reductase MsrB [Botrimarina hoheduenensis]|uniref:Peptide methionine sulfoxide reductase MsrB n=1 Tax=Botrimarina hoheduenensis TaxID=2528000 RepID=A0A5C5VQC0_9BACT|nr:peptide-methionine (R)-S-oxide reductase MsrB [Botrimarina hoheduenensis]TWT40243.1 Peptide methionine sulfoxide reductase MsrB [Botrimarina hoheduenensis]
MSEPSTPHDATLRERLTPEQYQVTQHCGTEPPFTGAYWNHKEPGVYRCVCCQTPLFDSQTKFDSGTGWPSFFAAVSETVAVRQDSSHGMVRDEIICKQCQAHLGHVFPDGPKPSGLRYCVNSASLVFEPSAEQA